MAQIIQIKTEDRGNLGTRNSRRLRNEGLVPAVLYGKKRDNVHLVVHVDDLERALKAHAHVLQLALPGGGSEAAVVKDVQYDNVNDAVLHVDFGRVDLDEQIEIEVAIRFTGESIGVQRGGHLETNLHNITLSCRADQVPDELLVDITDLGIDDELRVGDLKLAEGTSALADAEVLIVACRAAVEAPEEGAGEGPSEPELVARPKKEGEGEG